MVRLMTLLVLLGVVLAHVSAQTDLLGWNWLWLSVLVSVMGLQATFTGWCPAEMLGKLSKSGECCPGGHCGSTSQVAATADEVKPCCDGDNASQASASPGCCGGEPTTEKTACGVEYVNDGKVVKVLGSGCANCQTTANLIQAMAEELSVAIELEKVEDFAEIAAYGVMSTPGVVIDEVVVHSGGIPSREQIKAWLS